MTTEIETIVRGFRANVMQEILFHRVINGAGTVAAFKVGIDRHKQRTLIKLQDMQTKLPGEALQSAAAAINDMTDAVVARVETAGRVDFADNAI